MEIKEKKSEISKEELGLWIHYHEFLAKAIGIGVASILLLLLGIVPMVGRFYRIKKSLKAENVKLEELSRKVTVADNLDQNIVNERIEFLNKVLPPTKDVVIYLNTLSSLAKEFNLSLGDVSLSPGVIYEQDRNQKKQGAKQIKTKKWQTLATELRIVGSKDNVYQFLRQVEKTAPLMVVKDVQMSRVGSKTDKDSFVLTLKLGMVYAKPQTSDFKGEIKLLTKDDQQLLASIRDLKSYPLAITNEPSRSNNSQRDDLFTPGFKVKEKDQFLLPQPELSSQSSESAESSQSSQVQIQK